MKSRWIAYGAVLCAARQGLGGEITYTRKK